jgi:hypothetical protein
VTASIDRRQVLAFRVHAQQLDRPSGRLVDTAILDIGVQDSGPDGGLWALAIRGVDTSTCSADNLVTAWTARGAPHRYRRGDIAQVAAALEPFSDADAGKRIFDASRPLKAAGIGNVAALDAVAGAMRSVVTRPMPKGEVSTRLTALMDPPYLRFCRARNATHLYEMPFRLAALRAGLELRPGTSPPVLQRIPRFRRVATRSDRHDLVRGYLRLLGPATPKHVAEYLDAPVKDVTAHWPADAVEVSVVGQRRWALAEDEDRLTAGPDTAGPDTAGPDTAGPDGAGPVGAGPGRVTRLLGPFDLFLQARDRPLLVDDAARAKALWPVLGRPGAILVDGDIAGLWRPRQAGAALRLQTQLWVRPTAPLRRAIAEQAERLAAFRGVSLAGVEGS